MGQKINPHALRVGLIKDWDLKWYAEEEQKAFTGTYRNVSVKDWDAVWHAKLKLAENLIKKKKLCNRFVTELCKAREVVWQVSNAFISKIRKFRYVNKCERMQSAF